MCSWTRRAAAPSPLTCLRLLRRQTRIFQKSRPFKLLSWCAIARLCYCSITLLFLCLHTQSTRCSSALTRTLQCSSVLTVYSHYALPMLLSHMLVSGLVFIRMRKQVAPLWFFAQLCFNYSLSATTVTSNTILASTSSLFTYALSCVLLREAFTAYKLTAILLCIGGAPVGRFYPCFSPHFALSAPCFTYFWCYKRSKRYSAYHYSPLLAHGCSWLLALKFAAAMQRCSCPKCVSVLMLGQARAW